MIKTLIFVSLLLVATKAFAQENPAEFDVESSGGEVYIQDSLKRQTIGELAEKPAPSGKFEMSKSPWGAIWRSLVLPGWGQIYVESYWKAPIFVAGAGTMVALIVWNNERFQNAVDEIELVEAEDSEDYRLYNLRKKREFYRDNRDMSAFYLLAVYTLATIDAYTGAHLYDFTVDDDISLYPSIDRGGGVGLSIRINFDFKP